MRSLIGIDLGGTKIEIAVVDPIEGVTYKDRVPTPQHSYIAILEAISALVDKTLEKQKQNRSWFVVSKLKMGILQGKKGPKLTETATST